MDEILAVPLLKRFRYSNKDRENYTKKNLTHPYDGLSIPDINNNDISIYYCIEIILYINRKLISNNVNSNILQYAKYNWYEHTTNTFFPLCAYYDECFYYSPIIFLSTKDFIVWSVDHLDIHSMKTLKKTRFIFSKHQYINAMKKAHETILKFPDLYNLPASNIFIGNNVNLVDYSQSFLQDNH